MLEVLNPIFWLCLPLALIPLIIHFLNKFFPTKVYFPNIAFVQQVLVGRKQLLKWRDLFFLLIRTLIILFLIGLFLQPIWKPFKNFGEKNKQRHVAILLDHSISMEYLGTGVSPYQKGVVEVDKILETLKGDDRAFVMLMEKKNKPCFKGYSNDFEGMKQFISTVDEAQTGLDINQALLALKDLGPPPNELYLVSDFQRSQYSKLDIELIDESTKLFCVPLMEARGQNRALSEIKLKQSVVMKDHPFVINLEVINADPKIFDSRVECLLGESVLAQQNFTCDSWSNLSLDFQVPALEPGEYALEFRLPDDDLIADNRVYASIQVENKENVALISDVSEDRSTFYLSKAMNPYEANGGAILPKVMKSGELPMLPYSGLDKALMCNMPKLNHDQLSGLLQYLNRGGKMICFIQNDVDVENINKLSKILEVEAPLRFGAKVTPQHMSNGVQKWSWAKFDSPYLKIFKKEYRHLLGEVDIYNYYQATSQKDAEVLIKYPDGTPAMLEWFVGAGSMLVMNFSVDELASNLPRQNLFPAWIHALISEMNQALPDPIALEVGQVWHGQLWLDEMEQISMTSPKGGKVNMLTEQNEENAALSFETDELGVYKIQGENYKKLVAVNAPESESDLRYLDAKVLEQRLAKSRDMHWVKGTEDYRKISEGEPLTVLIFYFLLGWMLLESLGHVMWRKA